MENQFRVGAALAQLLQDPEVFDATIELENGGIPGVIPAINAASAIALMDIFRFACRPAVKGYILTRRKTGEVIAAVSAAKFIEQVTKATTLKDPPPDKDKLKVPTLEFWDRTKVKPEMPMTDTSVKHFVVEMVVDGSVEKQPVTGMTKESVLSLLTQATCESLPRIAGWNLFDDAGKLVASVPAIAFIGQLADKTGLSKRPADPKAAGWRAVPVVTGTSEEFAEAIEKAKKEGRTPTGK
jgi:hypothetical protein